MPQDAIEVVPSRKVHEVTHELPEETIAIRISNGNKKHSQKYKRGALITKCNDIIYWASIHIIIANIIAYVLFFTFNAMYWRQLTVNGANQVIILIAVNLSVICLILWVGHVTSINEVGSFLAKALWGTFIISLLTTTVLAYQSAMSPPMEEALKIDSLEVIPYEKASEIFSTPPKGSRFAIKLILSGYKMNETGDLWVIALLYDGDGKRVKTFVSEKESRKKDFNGVSVTDDALPKLVADTEKSKPGKKPHIAFFGDDNIPKGTYSLEVVVCGSNSGCAKSGSLINIK